MFLILIICTLICIEIFIFEFFKLNLIKSLRESIKIESFSTYLFFGICLMLNYGHKIILKIKIKYFVLYVSNF